MAIKFGFSEWEVYVPQQERELHKSRPEEAMTVELRHPRICMRDVRAMEAARSANQSDGDFERVVFVENVRNIRNLSIDGRDITDPGELFDLAPLMLVKEIAEEVMRYYALSEEASKNYVSPSATPSSAPESTGGDAPNVTHVYAQDNGAIPIREIQNSDSTTPPSAV